MKKLLFVNNNMKIGGVQKSLCNLLIEISGLYDITLLLFDKSGDYLNDIPSNVKVISTKSAFHCLGISQSEAIGGWKLLRGFFVIFSRVFGLPAALKLISLTQRKIIGYDVAISFLHASRSSGFYGGCNEFVLNKVISKEKITFLHCDYTQTGAANDYNNSNYRRFDKIAACSEGCRQKFLEVIPEMTDRCFVVRNCNDFREIAVLSEQEPVCYDKSYLNILTVARLGGEKGIERVIPAIYQCVQKGYNVRYHIVGDGIMRSKLENMVKDLKIEENIFFYGNQANPYRFMKNADLLVLPSYHEAAPMVFDEAICMNLPILATKTTSTDEMILKVNAGWVCENSEDGILKALMGIASDPEALSKAAKQMREATYQFNNNSSVNQFQIMLETSI
ncbi:MAG: glycosyltransferase [Oscillospiraceae bacterium]|nr:glycosyltransferase [Oscillospiraceae bacterium]